MNLSLACYHLPPVTVELKQMNGQEVIALATGIGKRATNDGG